MYKQFKPIKNRKVEKKILCQIPQEDFLKTLQISPDTSRVAYILEKSLGLFKKKYCVIIDGIEDRQYDKIGSIVFSPDSKHIAYSALDGKEAVIIVDKKEIARYSKIREISFSPDSEQLAYSAHKGNKWFIVYDGKEGKHYNDVGSIIFSSDSKKMAYRAEERKKQIVVLNETEIASFYGIGEGSLTFSPDGQRFAFIAGEKNWWESKWFWIIDGQQSKKYNRLYIGNLTFSPDSKHFAYIAFAYSAINNGTAFVVMDNEERHQYDGITMKPFFSSDSNHMAYCALIKSFRNNRIDEALNSRQETCSFIIVDKKEGPMESRIDNVVIAPDNINVFYNTNSLAGCALEYFYEYPNLIKSYLYKYISPLYFSPDGQRLLFVVEDDSGGMRVVVVDKINDNPTPEMWVENLIYQYVFNEIIGEKYDDILPLQGKSYFHFSEPNKFNYVAYSKEDGALYSVNEVLENTDDGTAPE